MSRVNVPSRLTVTGGSGPGSSSIATGAGDCELRVSIVGRGQTWLRPTKYLLYNDASQGRAPLRGVLSSRLDDR